MKKDILCEIVEHKRKEVKEAKAKVAIEYLKELCKEQPPTMSLKGYLADSETGIIAEFKHKSPSKGWINKEARPEIVTNGYDRGGASAISVLTDKKFFGGSLEDLNVASKNVNLPLLRKDFIIDEYQLYQARVYGADAVLLIAACLEPKECSKLAEKAKELNLEVLLEIHSPEELEYVTDEISLVGVNNRNLGTFHTDIDNSLQMASLLPDDKIWVAESGISSPEIVKCLRGIGYRGFLIGEVFMRFPDPGEALSEFVKMVRS